MPSWRDTYTLRTVDLMRLSFDWNANRIPDGDQDKEETFVYHIGVRAMGIESPVVSGFCYITVDRRAKANAFKATASYYYSFEYGSGPNDASREAVDRDIAATLIWTSFRQLMRGILDQADVDVTLPLLPQEISYTKDES